MGDSVLSFLKAEWKVSNIGSAHWASSFMLNTLHKFVHLGLLMRRQFLRNQPIRNKNFLWRSCLLMDGNEMSILYREPSKDASYQISIHLAKQLHRRRFFRNQPIRNKNCLWQPCLIMDRDEMSNLYRGPAIDAFYPSINKHERHRKFLFLIGWFLKNCLLWDHLAKMNRKLVGSILGKSFINNANLVPIRLQTWPPKVILVSDWSISKYLLLCNCLAKWPKIGSIHFGQVVPEETIFKKSTYQKQEFPVAFMFINGSGRNEQSL
jgi:hypothetical protein